MKPDHILQYLLQYFNDYDIPLEMTAEDVRELLIKAFQEMEN